MMKKVSRFCHYPDLHGMLKSLKEEEMKKLLYLAAAFTCLYVGALVNVSFFNAPESPAM